MLNLYRSSQLPAHWVAYADRLGWVIFPAKPNGWNERKPYHGETAGLMRIPPRLGFNTGFPHPDAALAGARHERIFAHLDQQDLGRDQGGDAARPARGLSLRSPYALRFGRNTETSPTAMGQ